MKIAVLSLALATAVGIAHAQVPPSANLSWMAGAWVQCGLGGAVTEEHWLGDGDALAGVNRSRDKNGTVSWEHLRIGMQGGQLAYFASPQSAYPPTIFRLVSASANVVVFENPDNDFPKRLTYRRTGNTLTAAATDLSAKGPTWRFRMKTTAAPCSR